MSSRRPSKSGRFAVALLLTLIRATPPFAQSATFTPKDLQVLGRAAAFMVPPLPADALVAIAYASGNAASRQDAEAISAALGGGLRVGSVQLRTKLVDVAGLASGGFAIAIAASGADGPQLAAAARSARALCVSHDIEAVRTGMCTMAITTEPRVEITINHANAAAAGIDFAAAFRMMVREL